MRIFYLFIAVALLLFTQCKRDKPKTASVPTTSAADIEKIYQYTSHFHDYPDPLEDSTTISSDSTTNLGIYYKALLKSNDTIYLVKNETDALLKYKPEMTANSLQFTDFNHDGLNDCCVMYSSQTEMVEGLFLFDKRQKNFIWVQHFEDFPDPIAIDGTKYYYSYHKSGCADADWDSDLFYLDHFRAICIGNIHGLGCAPEPQGIFIYKVTGKKRKLQNNLPLSTLNRYEDYKWGFIKTYWTTNFLKFVPE